MSESQTTVPWQDMTRRGTRPRRRRPRLGRTVWNSIIFLLYLFLLAPVLIVFVISFDTQTYLGFPPEGFTLDWYIGFLNNQEFIRGLQVSAVVATATATVAVLVSLPASLALTRHSFRGRSAFANLFLSPLLVPTVVLGLALLLALSPFGLIGTYPGLVVAHLAITIPYVIRTTMIALSSADVSCEEAARTLGASPWNTFRRVTLPLAAPGILAGAAIAFIISFDEAVIALFVVGPDATTLPVEIYRYVEYRTDPQIAAVSVFVVCVSVIFVVLIERILGLKRALR
ncbi:putative spermidine/putrescine transport system permease protein [Spinactinospora alkalitolerans]|uniref:Putative spermidine/putrescine transport system permease protein n=1 Tax=Spinactinospora alkalitolerans TaxID=687207 RepID=A0A852U3M5_9ACTN|nr:ABC transporter permease [Spinactinospora alkalitolerans]NYE50095.1 putative spermidine/putrescine transport system permease protein [Spinactinospora alkalitolerans]